MKNLNQNDYCRLYIIGSVVFIAWVVLSSFENNHKKTKFEEIDVERINIVEKDGTVKMILTNKNSFPSEETVNGKNANPNRPKMPGILFYNSEGIECGGLVYDGNENNDTIDAGMSLTFDQYNADQIIQLLYSDSKANNDRSKTTGLIFSDRPDDMTQEKFDNQLKELRSKNFEERSKKMNELQQNGFFGRTRIYLGKNDSKNDGLFLYDNKGNVRAMLYVGKDNRPRLEFYDEQGKIIDTYPK
jgi:hypothetical protein